MRARPSAVLALIVSLLSSGALAQQRPDPVQALEARRGDLRDLSRRLLARIDEAEKARAAVEEQPRAVARIETELKQTTAAREVAELAVKEYVEGDYPQEHERIQGDIKLAESELVRAKERAEWSQKMKGLGFVSGSEALADRQDLERAEIVLSNAKRSLHVLRSYIRNKRETDLKKAVERAAAEEQAKRTALAEAPLERARREQSAAEAALSRDEVAALDRLDEVFRLRARFATAGGEAAKLAKEAKEKLDEAIRLYEKAQEEREARRDEELARRVGAAARRLRERSGSR